MSLTIESPVEEAVAPQLLGVLAEFHGPHELVDAAAAARQAGYTRLEAFSPFPVHGIDDALGVPATKLPWLVLVAGLCGGGGALMLQWWTNAVDYPFLISGKPLFSLPASIPVTFEVIILLSAFGAFFGMLAFNGLPKLANPLFRSSAFRRATGDRFFLWIAADDPRFEAETTRDLLSSLGAERLEDCLADPSPAGLPRTFYWAGALLAVLAVIPPLLIAKTRSTLSDKPRIEIVQDMDFQPKFKPQAATTLFADGRADRLPVSGTVARGELEADDRFYRGLEPESDATLAARPVALQGDAADEEPQPAWVTEIPLPVNEALMQRGRERYKIYCATCHGLAGDGDGLVSVRAAELQQGTWVPPTSIHAEHVRTQPVGQLFHAITHGVRKMPAYGAQVPPADRWAIVLYLRALQRSRTATPADVPADQIPTLRDVN